MANTYLVGIVFDKIPERTLVWSANRDDEAQAGSNISLTSTGGFVLIHKNGTEVSIYNGKDICSASMSDNGNFMLFDSSSSIPTWQSFGHPTDNLLAGTEWFASFLKVLHIGHQLYSSTNITTNDYSTGRYGLDVANGGNVLLTAFRNGDPAYNYKGTSENTTAIVFNQTTALLYVVNATEITYPMTTKLSVSVEDYYRRAFLDDQGNLRQLYRIKNGGDDEWITAWKLIEKPCLVSNICGAFGICTNGNDITICECLEGFGNSDFPFPLVSDVSMVGPTMDKSKCEEAVRKDCFAQQPFGVMLLEIIFCGREEETQGDDGIILVDWVVSFLRAERD
uniref:Bulb-type lectin domain-containing protein n=1 Tax=Cucumis melo TaxID=3656 RepID=A0A9I9CPF7_CUCME